MTVCIQCARHWTLSGVLLALVLVVAGCATQSRALLQAPPAHLPPHAELDATPFFPQERYQCGPATLAMALGAAGIPVAPDVLVPQVYVPQREGSLQPEMLAAARRNGALAMTIPDRLDALLTEVAAGNPVIVLQNLSLPWFPLWHYALVIGYDLGKGEVVLRSGTTERLALPMTTFENTWNRSDRWAMVATPPQRLPATVGQEAAVKSLVAFEKSAPPARARIAYTAALQRWPRDLTLQLGLGNAAYAQGDRTSAADAFRQAAQDHPNSAAAFNNLATVLAEQGQWEQASRAAETAVALGGPWKNVAQETLQSVRAARQGAGR